MILVAAVLAVVSTLALVTAGANEPLADAVHAVRRGICTLRGATLIRGGFAMHCLTADLLLLAASGGSSIAACSDGGGSAESTMLERAIAGCVARALLALPASVLRYALSQDVGMALKSRRILTLAASLSHAANGTATPAASSPRQQLDAAADRRCVCLTLPSDGVDDAAAKDCASVVPVDAAPHLVDASATLVQSIVVATEVCEALLRTA